MTDEKPDESEEAVRKRRAAAFRELMKRLKSQPAMDIGPWTRDELYERGSDDETPASPPNGKP
jgi:hypothetical protein